MSSKECYGTFPNGRFVIYAHTMFPVLVFERKILSIFNDCSQAIWVGQNLLDGKSSNRLDLNDILDHEIVLFCGAGISIHSGLPSADNLKENILQAIGMNENNRKSVLDRKIPFEAFMQTVGDFINLNEFFKIFTLAEPNFAHAFIAKLFKAGKLKVIITTNFDDCIEKALESDGLKRNYDFHVLYKEEDFDRFQDYTNLGKITLVKIHGDAHFPDSVRTTLRQVASKQFSKSREYVLNSIFTTGPHQNVLFLGYSCSDIFDINPAIENITQPTKGVIFVEHSKTQSTLLEDINARKDIFSHFKGLRIFTNTDNLVSDWLSRLEAEKINFNDPIKNDWKKEINNFYKNTSIVDPTIGYTLCGEFMHQVGELRLAISYHSKSLNLAKSRKLWYNVARSYALLGNCYSKLGDSKKATQFHMDALKLAVVNKDSNKIITCRTNLASDYFNMGDYKKGYELILENIDLARGINNETSLAISLGMMGNYYSYISDPKRAISYHEQALMLSEKIGELKLMIDSYGNLAGSYKLHGDLAKAIDTYKKALSLSEKIGDESQSEMCISSIGSCLRMQGKFLEAMNWSNRALEIARKTSQKKEIGYCLKEIAGCKANIGLHKDALRNYGDALKIFREIRDKDNVARTLGDIGVFYLERGVTDLSLNHLTQSLQIAKKTGSNDTIAWALTSIGNCYMALKQIDSALNHYREALGLSKKVGDLRQEAQVHRGISSYYFDKKEYDKSNREATEFIDISMRLANSISAINMYYEMWQRFSIIGRTSEALEYYQKAEDLCQSIEDENILLRFKIHKINFLIEQRKFSQAFVFMDEVLHLLDKISDYEVRGAGLITVARLYLSTHDFKECVLYSERALDELNKGESPINIMKAHINAGFCYKGMSETDKAFGHYREALIIAERLSDSQNIDNLKKEMGEILTAIHTKNSLS